MENIYLIRGTLSVFFFNCVIGFNDFSSVDLLARTKILKERDQSGKRNNFLSDVESLKLTDISPERTDQIMSAEYMFNFMNSLGNDDDILKASGMLQENELEAADTVRSFSSKAKSHNRAYDVYKFRVHSLSLEEQIKRVEIRLLHNTQAIKQNTRIKYVVQNENGVILKFHSKEAFNVDGKYAVIDLSKTVKPVMSQTHGNLTIKISIKKPKIQKRSRDNINLEGSPTSDALLIVYSEDKAFLHKMYEQLLKKEPSEQLARSKRAIQKKRKRKNRNKTGRRKRKICQLEDFEIDFNHLGWGQWVVHPKVFNAKICTGVCPSPVAETFTPTNHAMLQSLMRLGQPKNNPMPCCVPTKLKPIKLLYLEEDEIVVRRHDDMIASSCGCR